ncbi:type I polyketide synthase [Gorillibacterium timonense]|uniref:type I polyketide synthase n=1 Tax=Gorillibacterium timonense TaxID=1689269 RepID=UPI00071C232E|nr:type I polyketide synthase [Gorillibacterium timonense]
MRRNAELPKLILEQFRDGHIEEQAALTLLASCEEVALEEIAVIGMACRFADAEDPEQYWQLLKSGASSIGEFPVSRLRDLPMQMKDPEEWALSGYLPTISDFDAEFFRISPGEARLMNPVQRIFLEEAYAAIEDSGYGGTKLSGTRTGVYVGLDSSQQSQYLNLADSSDFLALSGSVTGVLSGRLSYILNLKGPNMVIDTACSSGLVAVHTACQAIRSGECDMAIAGGVQLSVLPQTADHPNEIEAHDGILRAFARDACGTVWGEGAGVVVLKLLSKALEDKDPILAVIKGSAVNCDGASNGLTAPNADAQAELLTQAWNSSGIHPETLSYIETHGTGTPLGDPIEIKGLMKAFELYTDKKQFCGIGSVKANIGHTVGASGMASLLKVILCMNKGEIPPLLHFQESNPHISFPETALYVNDKRRVWEQDKGIRRAGVSSFGFSGTNCHVVLEEPPPLDEAAPVSSEPQILTLSAKNKESLAMLVKAFHRFVKEGTRLRLEDLCYTANTGRGHYSHRIAFVFEHHHELTNQLERMVASGNFSSDATPGIFCGHVQTYRLSEAELERLQQKAAMAMAPITSGMISSDLRSRQLSKLADMYVQGASIEWEGLYVQSDARRVRLPVYPFQRKPLWIEKLEYRGSANRHSLLGRCVSRSDAATIYEANYSPTTHWVLADHKIFDKHVIPGTTYLEMARAAGELFFGNGDLQIRDVIFLAPLILNSGESRTVRTVVSESAAGLEFTITSISSSFEGEEEKVHASGRIRRNQQAARDDGRGRIETIRQENNRREDLASLAGEPFSFGPRWRTFSSDAYYHDGIALAELVLPDEIQADLAELPLHPALLDNAVNLLSPNTSNAMYLPLSYGSIEVYRPITAQMYSLVQRREATLLQEETASFDITLYDKAGHVLVDIQDYVVKKVHASMQNSLAGFGGSIPLHAMRWSVLPSLEKEMTVSGGRWILFANQGEQSSPWIERLREKADQLIVVHDGDRYAKHSDDHYSVGTDPEDYLALFRDLAGKPFTKVIHAFSLYEAQQTEDDAPYVRGNAKGVNSLFYIVKALLANRIKQSLDIILLADYVQSVTGEEPDLNPCAAALFGLGSVVGREYSFLPCRSIDVDHHTEWTSLVHEIVAKVPLNSVTYRNGIRYSSELAEIPPSGSSERNITLKKDGAYLISGGLGGVGLTLAGYLSAMEKVHLILLQRTPFPERRQWQAILEEGEDERICAQIRSLQSLEEAGSRVHLYSCDITRLADVNKVMADLKQKQLTVHGIIHSAGIAGDGFLIHKEEAVFRNVMDPKIYGAVYLDLATREEPLDFFVLCSSIASLFPEAGQGDYTAANAFLDAYAAKRAKAGKPVQSVNWPAWKEVGMAARYGRDDLEDTFQAITPASAVLAFERLLQLGISNVAVGMLTSRVVRKETHEERRLIDPEESVSAVTLLGRPDGLYSEMEVSLARMWSRVLAIDEMNIYQSFNSLGGDSLQVMRLHRLIEEQYPGRIVISDVFTYPTLNKLSRYLEQTFQEEESHSTEADEIDLLLDQVKSGTFTF